MKHAMPQRRDPKEMQRQALAEGWQPLSKIPKRGEGEYIVLTFSGLIRRARSHRLEPRIRAADGRGPERTTVVATESGNYLTAIAWRWPSEPNAS